MGAVCLFLVYMYICFFSMAYTYVDERMSEIFLNPNSRVNCVMCPPFWSAPCASYEGWLLYAS
jgi:hypothetical protein